MSAVAAMSSPGTTRDGRDEAFLRAAIAYGTRALGQTAPNPAVGSLVVRDGVIVGRGMTRPGGRPHAETEALRMAGDLARGATLYVSLEPCAHHGKTPPCADAIIAAGIARVVSPLEDPDPRVAGQGHRRLVEAGVEVTTGLCAEDARRANLGHILRVTKGRPAVTLKLAETADGYAAGSEHDGRLMITGEAANNRTQMLRARHDAIMVGIGTVLADDPLMTVRMPGMDSFKPLRVVLDTHLRLPLTSRLVVTARDVPVLAIAGEDASSEAETALAAAGVTVLRVGTGVDGHVDLEPALKALAQRGVTRVLSEGGPDVAAALIARGFADNVMMFTSPKPLARAGHAALTGAARATLADGTHYQLAEEGLAGIDRIRRFERVL